MSFKGIAINYDYCTGCHSCEVACRVEHGYPDDQGGIVVVQVGPWQIGEDKYQYSFMPIITDQCDLCASRTAEGKDPTCVHHCQAFVMKYGSVDELAKDLDQNPKTVLYSLA
ncbi:MAG: oxidoreductase [Actinobacteria bacterium]|nr:oxidoreductase [Actinomycetota bacterium]